MTDPALAQRVAPSEFLRSLDTASGYAAQSLQDLREAQRLGNAPVPQEEIKDIFFTRRGDNQALNLLRGIVGQRLISRGLLEDPTDIAKRNLNALQVGVRGLTI
mgnify:CR=1 FL=1